MDNDDRIHRIQILEKRHKQLHSVIEALEAEKAPEEYIKRAKVEKLKARDEMAALREYLRLSEITVDKTEVM
jgi:hypothetical protein